MQIATTNNAQPAGVGASVVINGKPLRVRTGKNGAAAFLRANGYKISDRFLDALSGPLVNQGPEPATRWGRNFLSSEETLLAWAEARGRRQLEDHKARAERLRASRDAALERREARKEAA